MHLIIRLIFFLSLINTAYAQVYKCVNNKGHVVYQDSICQGSGKQSEVSVHLIDPEVTLKAQEKLNKNITQRQQLKQRQAEQALKEREIIAIEAQARMSEKLSRTAREQAEAIERNTAAIKATNNNNRVYYNVQKPHPPHQKKNTSQSRQESGLKLNISIK
mgnify:CR=1 FL=1